MSNLDASSTGFAPDACTLPQAERPLRNAEFRALFATTLRSVERVDDTHLRLALSGDDTLLPRVLELTERETNCCSFFEFRAAARADEVRLDVAVPIAYAAVLDGLAELAADAAGLPA